MSILNDLYSGILALVYPPRCLVCGDLLRENRAEICTECFSKISYTRFWEYSQNPMARQIRDMQPTVEDAAALLYYDNYSRTMIHRLKYKGEWYIAKYLGELLGSYLSKSPLYEGVEVIVPIPIHPLRKLRRGYNQTEYIARGIASQIGVKVNSHALYRRRYTSAQALKTRVDRWEDGDDLFGVWRVDSLRGRHILLVDDVYTTGATIFRAVDTLLRLVPDCRISIVTLATPM